jgi:hypothetical protein
MMVERLRRAWGARERMVSIDLYPRFTPEGLVMGAGTVMAPADAKGGPRSLDGQEARVLALLSVAYGRAMEPAALKAIDRAGKRWKDGEDCLALIHLALAGLRRLDDRDAARRLFMADRLMEAGIQPGLILRALDLDATACDAFKLYNEAQPRVPAGSGGASGEWTRIVEPVLARLSAAAARFLGRLATRAATASPYVLAVGLILVPRRNNLHDGGDIPELPGFRYDRDEAVLRITYDGPNGRREIDAMLGADRVFRDSQRVVAKLLPDDTLVIDPAEVSSDLADRDGPNLCPTTTKDKPGRPEGEKDKDYEDQIKMLINPDNPTPRGYSYKFLNPVTGALVDIDDCQHQTGARVEIKSEYDDLLNYEWGDESLTKDWLDQSLRQVQASQGFPVIWIFAQTRSERFARKLFDNAEGGRERIATGVVERIGASK